MSSAGVKSSYRALLFGFVVAAASIAATAISAGAAECREGQPSFVFDSPPDCACFVGSSPGTRIYGYISHIVVTFDSKAEALSGDATLACDARRIVIRTHRDNVAHAFPIGSTIMKVYENGVTAVFPGMPMDSELRRRVRNGSAILLKVL